MEDIPASHTYARIQVKQRTLVLLLQDQKHTYRRVICHLHCRTMEVRLQFIQQMAWRPTKLWADQLITNLLIEALLRLKSSHIKIKYRGVLGTTTEQAAAQLLDTSQMENLTSCETVSTN